MLGPSTGGVLRAGTGRLLLSYVFAYKSAGARPLKAKAGPSFIFNNNSTLMQDGDGGQAPTSELSLSTIVKQNKLIKLNAKN